MKVKVGGVAPGKTTDTLDSLPHLQPTSSDGGDLRVTALGSCALVLACGQGEPAPGGPDGPRDDRILSWRFEEVGRVQGPDRSPLAVTGLTPRQVAVGGDGRIAVVDGDEKRIILTDPQGEFLQAHGREGGGPGEFGYPFSVTFDSSGGIEAYDLQHQARVAFRPDGKPETRAGLDPRRMVWGGRVAVRRGVSVDSLLYIRDSVRISLAAVHTEPEVAVPRRVCPVVLGQTMAPLLGPTLVWDTDGERVAVVEGPGYIIRVWRGMDSLTTLRRPIAPIPGTPTLVETYLGTEWSMQLVAGPSCRFPYRELAELVGVARQVSVITEVRLLGEDLWVRRRRPEQADSAIDVWNIPQGYLGTLPGETPFPVAPFREMIAPAIVTDENELRYVALFRIVRGT